MIKEKKCRELVGGEENKGFIVAQACFDKKNPKNKKTDILLIDRVPFTDH